VERENISKGKRMTRAIVIGGSAGSYKVVLKLISSIPKNSDVVVFICLHRLRSARNGFSETMRIKSPLKIFEPIDKQTIEKSSIYVAPANYHMIISENHTINLSVEEEINHSRPSIDLTFHSAAELYRSDLMGIILSGANHDGAFGMKKIREYGGITIAQDPSECEISVMPEQCIENKSICRIESTSEIIRSIQNFIFKHD
jgi:two-component system chemotaxis response regulator CheB